VPGDPCPGHVSLIRGFVPGEGPSVLGGTLTCSTPATKSSPPGTYAITPAGLTSGNYAIKFVNGTLTVISYSQATTNLQAQVNSAGLPQGTQNSLDSTLQAALASFTQGNRTAATEPVGGVHQPGQRPAGQANRCRARRRPHCLRPADHQRGARFLPGFYADDSNARESRPACRCRYLSH
jgi:hypothetical protein